MRNHAVAVPQGTNLARISEKSGLKQVTLQQALEVAGCDFATFEHLVEVTTSHHGQLARTAKMLSGGMPVEAIDATYTEMRGIDKFPMTLSTLERIWHTQVSSTGRDIDVDAGVAEFHLVLEAMRHAWNEDGPAFIDTAYRHILDVANQYGVTPLEVVERGLYRLLEPEDYKETLNRDHLDEDDSEIEDLFTSALDAPNE